MSRANKKAPKIVRAELTPLTEEQMMELCAPKLNANTLVALLRLHALTVSRPLSTIGREWLEGVTYGINTSDTIELLVNRKRWLERRGNDRFAITEAGVEAARAVIELAGELK